MILTSYIPIVAFLLGFFGSVHCAAMCGGISGYLAQGSTPNTSFKTSLALAAGRLLSYAIAGMIAASMGSALVHLLGHHLSHQVMQTLVGLFLILLGISLAGWWSGLSWVEKIGSRFWRYLAPFAGRLMPINNIHRAFAVGTIWGWLPCGLVYSALVLVLGTGDIILGAVSMIAFGLGTAPVLLLIGITSRRVALWNQPVIRKLAGVIVAVYGTIIFTGLTMSGMSHH